MSAEQAHEGIHGRLPDWGPIFIETPDPATNPYPFAQLIAEPWNGASAALFVVVVIYWLIRLRGHYRQFPFLCSCLPILLVGGVGGTLFHALRISPVFFLMDVIPIYVLGIAASLYLWFRLGPRAEYVIGVIALIALFQLLGQIGLPTHWAINVSYASLAVIILLPLALVLVRTRFRYFNWVVTAFVCFGIAWFFRIADATIRPALLPMGTHWLWHVFGAGCTMALSQYFYLLEQEKRQPDALTQPIAEGSS